jgi:hypothetical protein
MGEILKFVAFAFLIVLILTFTLPLLSLVINMFGWLFGDFFIGITTSDIIWLMVIVAVFVIGAAIAS